MDDKKQSPGPDSPQNSKEAALVKIFREANRPGCFGHPSASSAGKGRLRAEIRKGNIAVDAPMEDAKVIADIL